MSASTTLNMSLNNGGFLESLRAHIQETADRDENALGQGTQWGKRHVSALRTLDHYLAGLGMDDQRIVALSQVTMAVFGTRQYQPTDLQTRLLARLGETDAPPSSAETLEELVAASAFDVIATLANVRGETAEANRRLEEKAAELMATGEQLAATETDLMAARDENAALTEEKAELQENVETLRRWVADGEASGEKAESDDKRRISLWKETGLPEHKGIYYRDTSEGRVYEVGHTEDGTQRWKTVGADLEEAIALRFELTEKPAEQKEKVAA